MYLDDDHSGFRPGNHNVPTRTLTSSHQVMNRANPSPFVAVSPAPLANSPEMVGLTLNLSLDHPESRNRK